MYPLCGIPRSFSKPLSLAVAMFVRSRKASRYMRPKKGTKAMSTLRVVRLVRGESTPTSRSDAWCEDRSLSSTTLVFPSSGYAGTVGAIVVAMVVGISMLWSFHGLGMVKARSRGARRSYVEKQLVPSTSAMAVREYSQFLG